MNEQEIIEGNKLIAEFMNGRKDRDARNHYRFKEPFLIWVPEGENYPEQTRTLYSVHKKGLRYHSSWDWIMPVVEKIENLYNHSSFDVEIKSNQWCVIDMVTQFSMAYSDLSDKWKEISVKGESKIESVWLAVIQFIKWYNSQTSPDRGHKFTER